ncbi:hypothetical protein BIW11_05510 [Tropilaelaps mercedesae]|uniref:Uncharacterized protein n=1 Tax=Tropilaelaps mercedesae TaxID=418985 RepID=A0A1V9Y227_9ACAR|nr:hypothetical protein BIW11_05510 [Tropilaelaps mercedesae]
MVQLTREPAMSYPCLRCCYLRSPVHTYQSVILNLIMLALCMGALALVYLGNDSTTYVRFPASDEDDSSVEEVDMSELENHPQSRSLPSGYMSTLELYRNRIRYEKGLDKKLLTIDDFKETYGRNKIPYREEIQRSLQIYQNKRD